jgi:2,3,4,5-tetrahydropyridine-2-carboxylate N-succinyltransferase
MLALGLGIGTLNSRSNILEVFFPAPVINPADTVLVAVQNVIGKLDTGSSRSLDSTALHALAEALGACDQEKLATAARQLSEFAALEHKTLLIILIDTDVKPASTADVYLRLHLLSHRLCKPHTQNLEGMFGLLPNVAWTNEGAIDLDELTARQLAARAKGSVLSVSSVDKFPPMADYVVPKGVRIADAARVRLGAYIGEGTTIMHEGFVNFNAGTVGTSMIEGRISAGVMVGEGSDLGGGCSTMGTLSGGGNMVIAVGKNSLIGANAGIGIPLGDSCKVEAGLYITAGTKVAVLDNQNQVVKTVKARELAGHNGLLFRRNSANGRVEVVTNKSAIQLNEALHAHN